MAEGISMANFSQDKIPRTKEEIFSHCKGMLEKMEGFIKRKRWGEYLRWQGFIIGCLWVVEEYNCSKEAVLLSIFSVIEILVSLDKKDESQAFIFLGFIQGCLW